MKEKGLIKVFNGKKYKTVSYKLEGDTVYFTTANTSNKYRDFKSTGKIKVQNKNGYKEYDVNIIEDEKIVDETFSKMKSERTIPFFIPRKNKIIVKYKL